jgi:hypothetical protein
MPGLHHVAPLRLSRIVTKSHTAAHKFKVMLFHLVMMLLPCRVVVVVLLSLLLLFVVRIGEDKV